MIVSLYDMIVAKANPILMPVRDDRSDNRDWSVNGVVGEVIQ